MVGRWVVFAEPVVDPGDVEAESAGVVGVKVADLYLQRDEAVQLPIEEQQVKGVVLAGGADRVLTADERETGAELEQEPFQLGDQSVFEVAFGDRAVHAEEVEQVGVAGHLLGEFGLAGRQGGREVGRRRSLSGMELSADHVLEHRPAPPVLNGLGRVPALQVRVGGQLVEQDHPVAPRQFPSRLLGKSGIGMRGSEPAYRPTSSPVTVRRARARAARTSPSISSSNTA